MYSLTRRRSPYSYNILHILCEFAKKNIQTKVWKIIEINSVSSSQATSFKLGQNTIFGLVF